MRLISVVAALAATLIIPSAAFAASRDLHTGSRGSAVTKLQIFLHDSRRGDFYRGGLDGLFGPITRSGLRQWQDAAGYPVTGRISSHSRQWNQLRREATVSRLPYGIDRRAVRGARASGWSVDASKRTYMLYLLRYDRTTHQVVVALATPTSFGGCNSDGCFTTPDGAFPVCRKAGRWEVSNEWKDAEGRPAPMPWAVYMYIDGRCSGVAIHQDPLGNSHECVHVASMSQAAYINHHMPLGALVVIHH